MLWTILVILLILWLLGFIGHIGGNPIHILLVSNGAASPPARDYPLTPY